MKNQFKFNLFIALLLAVTAVGCSFKKDHQKLNLDNGANQPVEQKALPLISLEEVFELENESEIVEKLAVNFNKYEKDAKTANETLLDVAIRKGKIQVIKYLMFEKGVNPFQINRKSNDILDANSILNDLLVGAHKDVFISILQNRKSIQAEVLKYELAEFGCLKLSTFLMRYKYELDLIKDPQSLFTKSEIEDFLIEILSQTECKKYVDSFPVTLISEWMTQEFINQFRQNFQSATFIKFLNTLSGTRKNAGISVKVPNLTIKDNILLERDYKVIPAQILVKLKAPCMDSQDQVLMWTELSKGLQHDFNEYCNNSACINSISKVFYNFVYPNSVIAEERFDRIHYTLSRREKLQSTITLSKELCGKEVTLHERPPIPEPSDE